MKKITKKKPKSIKVKDQSPNPPKTAPWKTIAPGEWVSIGINDMSRRSIDHLEFLRFIAKVRSNEPDDIERAELAGSVLADMMAMFVQSASVQIFTPEIQVLYRDKASSFRKRWDYLKKSTKPKNLFIDLFAESVWNRGWEENRELMREKGGEPDYLWKCFLEPIGRDLWPRWMTLENIEKYRNNCGSKWVKDMGTKATGWTKGNWRGIVQTAVIELVKKRYQPAFNGPESGHVRSR